MDVNELLANRGRGLNRFLRKPEVIKLVGLSDTTIWRMEKRGEFPQRRQLSQRAVGWLSDEVFSWMENRHETVAN